ncbi:phosphatase PAP2 family protein [Reinekea marina]|uniref:undecaprenyl-diphosphate phosphatase n=1 Tax=Reinekea marina TaxID=1310421 RepID=A0ABV7WTM0_9GAMM|nr:phosphatase PAP2 family protein [Reinekea marina]MBU2862430.1 phosphatase PAP2 family protein [Reinekea forsetii]MDN3649985.1 phosphatase PAP2 family protein [Reinekea marina]
MKLLNQLSAADLRLFHCLDRQRSHAAYQALARFISKSADGEGYLLVLIIIGLQYTSASLLFVQIALCAIAIERLCYFILKNSLKRNRPANSISDFKSLIQPSDQFSFPSGHTSAAFLFATLMASYYPALTGVFYSWAVLVAYSRVLLGVHFPFDTIMGAALGSLIGTWALLMGGWS